MLSKSTLVLGKFLGRLSSLGFDVQSQAVCETIASEIVNSAAIEGEALNRDSVRSSVAKRMEIAIAAARGATTHTDEARADMMLDATRNCAAVWLRRWKGRSANYVRCRKDPSGLSHAEKPS